MFSVPLTPSIAGSVVIWYCIVDNSPVDTQERDMVESVVPFSVILGHGGRPSVRKPANHSHYSSTVWTQLQVNITVIMYVHTYVYMHHHHLSLMII